MSGLVALLGGQEHMRGCEPIDRRLLAESGVRRPQVTVLLAATVPRRIDAKVTEAGGYWSSLGARVRFAYTGPGDGTEQALAALADPDLVVLTGGRPWLIQQRLTAPVVDRLRRLSADGVPVSGSSAGAMALCDWRMHIEPGVAPRIRPAIGLAPGIVAPHHGRYGISHLSRIVACWHPDVPLVALADRTALVGRGGTYEVMGAGACMILHGTRRRDHTCGEVVDLRRTAVPAGADVPATRAAAGVGQWAGQAAADLWQPGWTAPAMTTSTVTPP